MTDPQPSGGFEWTQEPWGKALRCRPLGLIAPHLFTIGNVRLVDDRAEWRAIAERMGVAEEDLRLIRQVHGADVTIARKGNDAPAGRPTADIILSDDPDVAIGVRVADCAPVLIGDRQRGVVGAAHAGWRGTVQRAAAVAVEAMQRTFGSDPAHLVAAIGPCLGPCCGEVGLEVVDAFREAGHAASDLDRWFKPASSDRARLDLWGANRDQLEAAGIPAAQIHVAEICTKTHASLFHSYRVQKEGAGRMLGVIRVARSF